MRRKSQLLKGVDGLQKVDPQEFARYRAEMKDKIIPEIEKVIEKRRLLAEDSRHRQLEVLKSQDKKD